MKKEKKRLVKTLSLLSGFFVLCGGISFAVYATGSNNTKVNETLNINKEETVVDEDAEISKDETVYVIAGANGTAKKIIVSDWIKNAIAGDKIQDKTDLENIINMKGDESYTTDGDNMHVWDAQGNDVYYQGNIKKELPVNIDISYKLDGSAISAEELEGKSGKVTIRFDYTNNQYEMVNIDGKQEKMYVPFSVLTGMVLNNDNFRNIDVTNGRLMNDGDRTVIAGIAFPGLSDNLNLQKDTFEIPDYVEITADVTDFEMAATISIATNELFHNVDLDNVDSLDDLSGSLDELTDAMNQLIDGSFELYDGLSTLLDKSSEMVDGINQLTTGAKKLSEGTGELGDGAAKLQDGAAKLAGGLDTLSSNNTTLNAGAKQVFESLLSMADSQLADAGLTVKKLTIDNYGTVLNGVMSSLDGKTVYNMAYNKAYSQVESAVRAQEAAISAKVEAAVQEKVLEGVLKAIGQPMTAKEYEAAVKGGKLSGETQAKITGAVEKQMSSSEIKEEISKNTKLQIKNLTDEKMKSDEVKSQINKAVESAKSGASGIAALKTQLDSYNQFYQGLLAYTDGVAEASSGAKELKNGTESLKKGTDGLKNGAGELYAGLNTLKEGSGALVDGVSQLKDGAKQLSDGLKEFNEQGVQKLIDAVDGDLNGLIDRLRATSEISKDYKSFAGISDDMDGSVRFIYKTDTIEMSDKETK
jgi:putative membrane protein